LSTSKNKAPYWDHDKIAELIMQGLIAPRISEQIGCSPQTVRDVAKAKGLTLLIIAKMALLV